MLAARLCSILSNPTDCSPPGSSVHGILWARILEWVAFPSLGDLPDPGSNLGLLHCRQFLYWDVREAGRTLNVPLPLLTHPTLYWIFLFLRFPTKSSHFPCHTPKLHIWALCVCQKCLLSVTGVMPVLWEQHGVTRTFIQKEGLFGTSLPLPWIQALSRTAWAAHLQHPSTAFSWTSFVPLHLHLALVPLEGTACLEMKFSKFRHLSLWGLLFLLCLLWKGFLSFVPVCLCERLFLL